jgi:hypothetical protein
MSIMDQVKKNLREWYSLAADRTGEMAKISVRMYDKYGISREIERQLSELGSYVYHAVEQGRSDFGGDAEFTAWIERIKELESDLDAKVEEIEEIRQARQEKQAAREREEAEARAAEAAAGGEAAQAPVEQPAGEDAAAVDPVGSLDPEDEFSAAEEERRSDAPGEEETKPGPETGAAGEPDDEPDQEPAEEPRRPE